MRICIFTFPQGINYGGLLQCYAMATELRKLGHEVKFLDYKTFFPGRLKHIYNTWRSSKSTIGFIKRFAKSFKYYSGIEVPWSDPKRWDAFDEFRRKYIPLTPVLDRSTIGNYMNENFDAVIIGSDQVWTNVAAADKTYFGGWSPKFKGLKISYAACSAHKEISKRVHKEFKSLFEDFDILTVRDKTTAHLVESVTGNRPAIVSDPTLLHDFKEFTTGSNSEDPYIATYILGSEIPGGHKAAIDKIKQLLGKDLKVKGIMTSNLHPTLEACVDEPHTEFGPEEWVRTIAGASALYTDSFHAIMFAMKFNIPFVAYYTDILRASRLLDLKQAYSLKGIVGHTDEITELSRHHIPTGNLSDFLPQLAES